MKLNILKNKTALVTAIALLLVTLTGFATATEPIEGHPEYSLEEVASECAHIYETHEQITQCIKNVCGFYGCSIGPL